ncbi:hypothetical protein QBC32DRAFT_331467 [Pseudoneurospora amorphoporcata]|uniref:Inner kinetochore subunit AME1 domain-containing protein n=1 Tax=Pseudoneurospora amorphoporcata TaxID=241081 RepID=A0AAN6SJV0_9PEZI|nr:hypothetical protein QBC32DRAFT_331467 [Pseudoneurospora amorphoporcata]
MATSRQERMQERMRGAHSHQVADTSFNFEIPLPVEEPSSEEPTGHDEASSPTKSPDTALAPASTVEAQPVAAPVSTRPTSNTSVKRSHRSPQSAISIAGIHTQLHPPQPRATSPSAASARSRSPETNDLSARSSKEAHGVINELPTRERPSGLRRSPPARAEQGQVSATSPVVDERSSPAQPQSHQHLKSPEPLPSPQPISSASKAHRRPRYVSPNTLTEEVDESPADAPGSGRRRPLQVGEPGSAVHGSSALLQRVLEDLDDGTEQVPEQSSPLERAASRKSGELFTKRVAAETRRSTRLSGSSPPESVASQDLGEEPSPSKEARRAGAEREDESASEAGDRQSDTRSAERAEDEGVETERPSRQRRKNRDQGEDAEKAREISDKEATKVVGRKRPRRAVPTPSPQSETRPSEEEPQPKRRRRQAEPADTTQQEQTKVRRERVQRAPTPIPSPPKIPQKQMKPQKPSSSRKPTTQNPPKPKKGRKTAKKDGAEDEGKGGKAEAVPITVQRFTKPPRASDGPDELNASVLGAEIPFANRAGVNAIDVLSELCEGLIAGFLARLEERARAADDAATKREQKTKFRTMEAFQEELRTRLLEHTIALDTLHALRKRVKVVQKEKLVLREEILRIRAERDQVSLRMDAIRIKHEVDSKEALRHISLSSAMHDIDLAVERGQAAPDLSPAEQKMTDLANLEFLISRVSGEVCNKGNDGGPLKQIKDFNAFLERAASVLEGR